MFNCAEAARLSPDERLGEIAAILAAGISRHRRSSALFPENCEKNLAESPREGLEVSAETRLSVRVG